MADDRKLEPYIEMECDGDNIHIGAYIDDMEVGFLDADLREDQILITCLYVSEEYRRHGIATAILDEIVDFLSIEELHIPLSMDYILEEGLDELHAFALSRQDFALIPTGEEYIIPHAVWNDCFGSKQLEHMTSAGKRINELTGKEKNILVSALREDGLYIVPEGKILTDIYDVELTHIAFSNDELKSGILIKQVTDYTGEELIELSVAICEPGSELWLMKLFTGFLANMRNIYPNHSLRIFGVNEGSINLVHKFFEKDIVIKQGYSAIWLGI